MNKTIIALCLAFGMLLGSAGCKSDAEKVCAKGEEWAKEDKKKDGDMEKCVEKMEKMLKECKDADGFVSCIDDAKDEKAAGECFAKCEKK